MEQARADGIEVGLNFLTHCQLQLQDEDMPALNIVADCHLFT
jgi:hypothetical protein